MKKALLIYESIYGNTKKVAMAISRGLEAGNIITDAVTIDNISLDKLDNYDIIGIGVPTYSNGMLERMKKFLKKIENLKLEGKYGFIFDTKGVFELAKSKAKSINKQLKNKKVKLILPRVAGIVIDNKESIKNNKLLKMEEIGLKISLKVNNNNQQKDLKKSRSKRNQHVLKYFTLILLGGGSMFFFIRAIQLASLGGDTFGSINPIGSWTLLSMEITFSGIAGIIALATLIFELRCRKELIVLRRFKAQIVVLIIGIIAYILHFIRVAIWLFLIL